MTWWQGARESATEWLTDHWLELGTLGALAYPSLTQYLKLPLLLLLIASALSAVLVVTVVIVWIIDGRDRRLGISHGIEHATIALLERLIRFGLGGFATPDSFVVRIPRESVHLLWRERVRDAAQRAIDQLAAGDRQLAYTPDCSTNWFAERAILCVCVFAFCAFAYVVSAPPHVGVLAVATAIWFARALGHVLGIALQWWVTVHTRWASVRIVDVEVGEGKDDHAGTYEFRVRLDIVPRPG